VFAGVLPEDKFRIVKSLQAKGFTVGESSTGAVPGGRSGVGHAILTPPMMVLLMITGDFLAMSATTDNVIPS
jgi:H+-transporting ATPase